MSESSVASDDRNNMNLNHHHAAFGQNKKSDDTNISDDDDEVVSKRMDPSERETLYRLVFGNKRQKESSVTPASSVGFQTKSSISAIDEKFEEILRRDRVNKMMSVNMSDRSGATSGSGETSLTSTGDYEVTHHIARASGTPSHAEFILQNMQDKSFFNQIETSNMASRCINNINNTTTNVSVPLEPIRTMSSYSVNHSIQDTTDPTTAYNNSMNNPIPYASSLSPSANISSIPSMDID